MSGSIDLKSAGHAVDLRPYLNFAQRYWMFIASVTAFALLIAVLYMVRATMMARSHLMGAGFQGGEVVQLIEQSGPSLECLLPSKVFI